MTNTKQTVLTDEQNAIIAARFPDDPANACRAQSAIVEILSKLHVADKPDGGDVTLRRGIEQWTASDPSSMSKQSPEAIYYALDDARSDILTLCCDVQRLSAALAEQPAASAEPSIEEC